MAEPIERAKRELSIELGVIEFVRDALVQSQKLSDAQRECLREFMEERFKTIHEARAASVAVIEQRIATLEKHFEGHLDNYSKFEERTNSTLANYAGRTIVLGAIITIALAILMRFWR